MEFASWVARMRTPENKVAMIRSVLSEAPSEVGQYFQVEADGSFSIDSHLFVAHRH